jgi:nitrogen fixation NifU-like protein
MYNECVLDHFQNPRNVGELPPPAVTVEVINPACGDILRLSASFDNGRVSAVGYRTRGCTASIAAGSKLTELMENRSTAELASLTPDKLDLALGGLPAESKHAAVLCIDALKLLLKKLCSA